MDFKGTAQTKKIWAECGVRSERKLYVSAFPYSTVDGCESATHIFLQQ